MKSYIENVAYQDLTAAIEKAHETLESIKSETKTAEHALKVAKKDGKSKFEISLLQLALRQQKLEEESQKIVQKVAELEREHWVTSFKKAFKKAEKEEKEATKKAEKEEKAAHKSSKGHLKITHNGENLDVETVPTEPKKEKMPKVKNIKVVVIESPEPAPTEPKKVKTPRVKKVKAEVNENLESVVTDVTE